MHLHSCIALLRATASVLVTGTKCDPTQQWLNHEGVCQALSASCSPQQFESWSAAGGRAAWRYELHSSGHCARASRIHHINECQLAALELGLTSGAGWERNVTTSNATTATAGYCRLRPADDGHRSPVLALDPHRCTPDRLCLCRAAERIADRHCLPLTACAAGRYQSSAPTRTSDRVCSALTVCRRPTMGAPIFEFESRAPLHAWTYTELGSGECARAQLHVASYAECRRASRALGLDRNKHTQLVFSGLRGCVVCNVDPRGRWLVHSLRHDHVWLKGIHPHLAQAHTSSSGSNASPACSAARRCLCRKQRFAIANRKCAAVSECEKWQFEFRAPTLTSNRECASTTTCTDSQFQIVAPSLTSDRQCAPASICEPNSFEFRPLTSTSDRVCRPLTICNATAGEVEVHPPRRGWRYTTRSWGQCTGLARRVLTSAECAMAAAQAAHDVLSPQLRVEFVTRFDRGGCYFMRRVLNGKAGTPGASIRGNSDWTCSADRRLCICRSHRVVIGDRTCDSKRGGKNAARVTASASELAKAGFAALNALLGDVGCGGRPCSSGVSCELSGWSSWGRCTRSCGGGTQERRRSVVVAPQRGGAPCGAIAETQSCGVAPCAQDCLHQTLKAWSTWGSCSATCGGGGTRTRTRKRARARAGNRESFAPQRHATTFAYSYGGKACPVLQQQARCNSQCCAGTHHFLAPAAIRVSACSVGCCLKCMPGKFAPDTGMVRCIPCSPGRYQPHAGAVICNHCRPGQYQHAHSGKHCNLCSPGRFASSGGHHVCTLCPAGHWSGVSGAKTCKACAPGTVGATATAYEHTNAEALADLVMARSQPCVACAPGRFQPRSAATACLRCGAGQFQSAEGGTGCLACSRGSVPTARSDSCRSCAPGHFTSTTSESDVTLHCKPCPRGRFVAQHGATGANACIFCRAGQYADTEGSAVCKQCPGWSNGVAGVGAKMRIGASGLLHCLVCPDGKWQTADGIAECAECEAGRHMYSVDGVSTCADCKTLDSARRMGTRGKAGQHKCEPIPLDCLPSPWGSWSGCQSTNASLGHCQGSRRGRQTRTRAPVPQGVDSKTRRCGLAQQSRCTQSWGGGMPCSFFRWREERSCDRIPCPPITATAAIMPSAARGGKIAAAIKSTADSSAIDSIYEHVDINIINAIDWGSQPKSRL